MSVPANFTDTYDVVASPTDASETVIAILSGISPLLPGLTPKLWALVTIEPDAGVTSAVLQVREDNLAGSQVGDAGRYVFASAGTPDVAQVAIDVTDFPRDFGDATYVLTLTCAGAAGATAVDSLGFHCRVD